MSALVQSVSWLHDFHVDKHDGNSDFVFCCVSFSCHTVKHPTAPD